MYLYSDAVMVIIEIADGFISDLLFRQVIRITFFVFFPLSYSIQHWNDRFRFKTITHRGFRKLKKYEELKKYVGNMKEK